MDQCDLRTRPSRHHRHPGVDYPDSFTGTVTRVDLAYHSDRKLQSGRLH